MEIFLGVVLGIVAASYLGVVVFGPPYVPTLKRDLVGLIHHLKLGEKDLVVDLGVGDGRVLVEARRAGALATGVEINPFLWLVARTRLRRYHSWVTLGNLWHYQLPEGTTYVFVFFAKKFMKKLYVYLETQAGEDRNFRVVSYGFTFEEKKPKETVGPFTIYEF